MTDYDIVYHEGFLGRAFPVVHLLLEAGKTFTLVAPTWGADRCVTPNPGHPVFAPPVLKKGDFYLSQTSAIMQYLGIKHGLAPSNPEDIASCNQATQDAADVLSEVLAKKTEEDKKAYIAEGGRFLNWMNHYGRILAKHGGTYLYGNEPTFADFALLSTLRLVDFKLPNEVNERIPENMRKWREAIEARSSTAALEAMNMAIFPESFR